MLVKPLRLFVWIAVAMCLASVGCADDDAGNFEDISIAEARIDPGAKLTLLPGSDTIGVAQATELSAVVKLSDGSTVAVTQLATWSSENLGVAWVQKGKVVGVSPGITSVTATYEGQTESLPITVTTEGLSGIEVRPAMARLAKGMNVALKATGVFTQGARRDITNLVRWQSSDETVARVDNQVLVATGAGSATVSAKLGPVMSGLPVEVTQAELSALDVRAARDNVPMGATLQLRARATFSDASSTDVTGMVKWVPDNSVLATIDADGLLRARNAGRVTVSAKLMGLSAKTAVAITAATLRTVEVTANGAAIPSGSERQLHAMGHYSDDTTVDITERAQWTTSDGSVIAVSDAEGSKGKIKAGRVGSAVVHARLDTVSGSTTLSTTPSALVAIVVGPADLSAKNGEAVQLAAVGKLSDGSSLDLTHRASWSSSDASIASLSQDGAGKFETHQPGSVRIRASLDGLGGLDGGQRIEGSTQLTVTSHELQSLDIGGDVSLPRGLRHALGAVGAYSDGQRTSVTERVTWASSDTSIAVVSNDPASRGVVSALRSGQATISASLDQRTAHIVVNVTEPVRETLSIQTTDAPLAPAESRMLRAVIVLSNGSMLDVSSEAKWTTSDQAVATIDATGNLTGHASGVATIEAVVDDMTAEIVVRVQEPGASPLP